MTVRTRRPERVGIRARLGGLVETEERQQAVITVLFIGTIVAVALIILGAVGVGYYNDNLRALGQVGSVQISPQMLKDETNFETWRLQRDEGQITEAQIAGQIDSTTAATKNSALQSVSQNLSTNALGMLVDQIYQSQLAPANGVTVSDSDINTRYEQEISSPEQRHIWVVGVAPTAADATNGPTAGERQAAIDKANQALSDLNAGKDFSEVAKTYGTDAKSQAGGDLGVIPQIAVSDDTLGQALFKLPLNGTSGVVRGADGTYYVGRVTEIDPGQEDSNLKSKLLANTSEASVRQLLGYQVAAEDLQTKIVNDALAQTPEQVKLATIYIDGPYSGDTNTTDGEIDYDEIVYAPNNDLTNAPDLDPNDPAWAAAKAEADAAYAQLTAITDPTQRATTFTQIATSNSDDPTSQDGGKVGYVTRDIPPAAVSDALWNGTHNKGDIIGPIKGDAGYYVLTYNDHRDAPETRVNTVQTALNTPGADFNALAKQYSDGPEKAEGGEIGWFTQDSLTSDISDTIWGLAVGQVSAPLELGNGHYFIKVEDKQARPLDADEQAAASQTAFSTWYQPLKDQATSDGTITTIQPLDTSSDLTTGANPGP
jgi:parvulin-like peptidyl-prolyl isomerase